MKDAQVIIIGGGLAGLTAGIHLSLFKIKVILIEKESFPHHKVCGEYLSNEVMPYLKSLNVDLSKLKPKQINRFEYSTNSGKKITTDLDLGGMGISRYNLDNFIFEKAMDSGCEFVFDTVSLVNFRGDLFEVKTSRGLNLQAQFVIGAYGKRSVIDKDLQRDFIQQQSPWLAVKSHYKNDTFPSDLVALHNFDGGYCGLSKTEMDTVNVCYLATYRSFRKFKNTGEYRENVLMKNPHLESFFRDSEPVFEKEVSIAQVSFSHKTQVEDHILMVGDAAGLIHPLCGNGMAMAIHSAKIVSESILTFFENSEISRNYVEETYSERWSHQFRKRLRTGRMLQSVLINRSLSELSQNIISNIPGILPHIIKRTHGNRII